MSKNSPFCPKTSQKAPRDPLAPLRMKKVNFFELPVYENPMLGKRIFKLSPIEKKVGLTKTSAKLPFWILVDIGVDRTEIFRAIEKKLV